MQSFTARVPLLTATRTFGLGRRCWSSPRHSTMLSTLSPYHFSRACRVCKNMNISVTFKVPSNKRSSANIISFLEQGLCLASAMGPQ